MNFWLNLILSLYPQTWRERYEDEFCAMLEQCHLSWFDWLDMLLTAIETRSGFTWRNIMQDMLNRLTGLIALVSALGFASILIISDEGTAELIFLISPLLSILLIPAMHRVLRIHHPNTSMVVMMIGIGAIGLLVMNFVFGAMTTMIGTQDTFIAMIIVISTIGLNLVGVWLIAVNVLASKAKMLPFEIALFGMVAGVGWIVTMTTTMVTSTTNIEFSNAGVFGAFYGMALAGLLLGYFMWAVGTGFYFISGKVSRKLQVIF